MKNTLYDRIKYWRDKYRDMPNGYFVSMIIGEEYYSNSSKTLKRRRRR